MSTIVSCEWLNTTLKEKPDNLVVADVSRYRSARNAKQDYECEHIVGAVFLDLFANVELTPSHPWNLATVHQFEASLRAAGINNDTHVILYSTTDKCGYFLSARAWWMFQHFGHTSVSILDGGFEKWLSLSFPVSSEVPRIKPGNFQSPSISDDLLTFDTVHSSIKGNKYQLIDTRSAEKYLGIDSGGHIPSALNVPADLLVDEKEGVLKTEKEIIKVLEDCGVDLTRPIATYCNSGMSSCMGVMAARLCGAPSVSIYLDGFMDWTANAKADEIINQQT